ncbi:retrovirus-related pol polyprotein from transposon TNT 1-94 [Tanacetum coccineum]
MAAVNDVPHLVDKKGAEGDAKPESQWTPNERRVIVQDQRLKSIIMSCLPDDIIESVISCVSEKETWTDLVHNFEGPSDTKENRIMDLKLEYQTFRAKSTKSISQTYTRYKTLLNELANDCVNLSKHEINVGFVNSLPKKWLTFSQGLRNANHTQTLDLADIYGRFVYEDNLIQIRTSEECLRDLDIEYHERALLANSKRFIKRRNNFSGQKANENTECYKCGNKADDELTVGKIHARNSEWVDITMRKVNTLLSMDEDADWQNYLKYINIDLKFVEEQRLNLLSKYNKMLNYALQEQLKEEKKINEKWLTSSKKVSQCISEQIPYQKNKVLGGDILTKSSSKKNENNNLFVPASTGILVPESQAINESLETSNTPESSKDSEVEFLTPLPPLKILQGASPSSEDSSNESVSGTVIVSEFKQTIPLVPTEVKDTEQESKLNELTKLVQMLIDEKILRVKAKPFPPCTHCGFNDHISDDYRNYPECGICGSYDHSTSGHNHVIQIRGGVLVESSQSNESSIGVKCNTCGSTVHSTSDHNEFGHFKRGEKIQARHIREPIWYLDSGCSRSMTDVKSYLYKYVEQPGFKFDDKQETIFNANKEIVLIAPRRSDVYVLDMPSLTLNGACFFAKAPETERKNRTLIEASRTMLNGSVLSKHFWTDAVRIACYTQNRSIIVKRHDKNYYEIFRKRIPDISYFYVFGCPVFIHNDKDRLGKFDAKADDGYFLGYSSVLKDFRVYNIRRKQIEETYHVTFDESMEAIRFTNTSVDEIGIDDSSRYPPDEFQEDDPSRQYKDTEGPLDPVNTEGTHEQNVQNDQMITQRTDVPSRNNTKVSGSIIEPLVPDVTQSHITNQASTSSHPVPQDIWLRDQHIELVNIIGDPSEGMLTRSMAAKLTATSASECLFTNFLSEIEPKKVSEALKHPRWIHAMKEELNQFYRNKVRTLVPLPYGKIAIVARMEAIRIFLAFATYMNIKVYQMDVKSVFPNGKLKEEVYVKQPPGFESSEFPNYVCKLDKAFYGLKQAPRAWYETLSTFLLQNKFAMRRIDNTLFIYKSKGEVLLVQVYVDDIIFGSTSYKLCKQFEKLMTKKFEMSMMGELTYFLGLHIKQDDKGILICQE